MAVLSNNRERTTDTTNRPGQQQDGLVSQESANVPSEEVAAATATANAG
jgi:hypothetical protein